MSRNAAINAAATADNHVIVYGDVAVGFFIVDPVGTQLELIPQALRLLDIPTTAQQSPAGSGDGLPAAPVADFSLPAGSDGPPCLL